MQYPIFVCALRVNGTCTTYGLKYIYIYIIIKKERNIANIRIIQQTRVGSLPLAQLSTQLANVKIMEEIGTQGTFLHTKYI